ncbi:MAG: EutN/CcmL family microcompartment protein [Polyangia bacterium]
MILGRVIGEVWATRKHAAYEGRKLLLVTPRLFHGPRPVPIVAVDVIDAGVGDQVIVCVGTPARLASGGQNLPIEAAVCAIVDRVELADDVGRRPLTWLEGA